MIFRRKRARLVTNPEGTEVWAEFGSAARILLAREPTAPTQPTAPKVWFEPETRVLKIAVSEQGLTPLRKAVSWHLLDRAVVVCDSGRPARVELELPVTEDVTRFLEAVGVAR